MNVRKMKFVFYIPIMLGMFAINWSYWKLQDFIVYIVLELSPALYGDKTGQSQNESVHDLQLLQLQTA